MGTWPAGCHIGRLRRRGWDTDKTNRNKGSTEGRGWTEVNSKGGDEEGNKASWLSCWKGREGRVREYRQGH